jgi:cyanophycinase
MQMSGELGPLVLAGSGEYTPTMDMVDKFLLERCGDKPVLLIATSCAQEGLERMAWWEQLGVAHFLRFGVVATPVRIVDDADANVPENAERIAEAGIVWFSGGSPPYLAQSFHETASFRALEAANRRGAAVAGSSGGLGVLNVDMPPFQLDAPPGPTGLGLAAPIRAMAHFDRMEVRRPEAIERTVSSLLPGQKAVGVDEDTAIVWVDGGWQVMGHKRAVVYEPDLTRTIFQPGDRIDILPPPTRSLAGAK